MREHRCLGRVGWSMAAIAASAAVAACGSSNNNGSSSGPSGDSSTTAQSGSSTSGGSSSRSFKGTINVAIISDLTGASSIGSGVQGALAYFDAVNASGGVDGFKIVAQEYDTATDPATAVQAVRRAIASKPAAMLSASFSIESAAGPMAQSGIPAVGDGAVPAWNGNKTLFSVLGDQQTFQSDAPLVILKKYAGATKIALFGSSYAAESQAALEHEAPSAGVQIVLRDTGVPLAPTSAQFLQAAQQIKSSGATGVVGLGSEGLSELQIDLNQLGVKAKVLANDELTKPTASQAGLLFSQQWANPYVTGNPGMTQYKADMSKYGFGSLIDTNVWTPLRYAEAVLLVQGLKQAGAPFANTAVVNALSKTKNFTAAGIIAPASFPEFQNGGGHCQAVMEIQGTTWKSLVNGPNPFVCGAPAQALK